MAHLKVAQGGTVDVPFRLREHRNGPLTDDDHWVDGSTAAEWPTVTVLDGDGNVVTTDFVKDITNDTLEPYDVGYDVPMKHPTPATGIMRDREGEYRLRVNPSLPLGDHTLRIVYDVNGASTSEEHDITIIASGDVDFLDSNYGIESADVLRGIHTSLLTGTVDGIILDSIEDVFGFVEDHCGIDPATFVELPRSLKTAIVYLTRGVIFTRDLSAGEHPVSVKEHTVTYKFGGDRSNEALANHYFERAREKLEGYCGKHGGKGKPIMNVTTMTPRAVERRRRGAYGGRDYEGRY